MKSEVELVRALYRWLQRRGFRVSTEVANFHRSADVAAISPRGEVWVVECKLTNIRRALTQTRVHMLAADRVFIATPMQNHRVETLAAIRESGVGLICAKGKETFEVSARAKRGTPVGKLNRKLKARILELV